MDETKRFSGPVIDRDVFHGLPDHHESDIPYFDVVNSIHDPIAGSKWRFWFVEGRGGWVWHPSDTLAAALPSPPVAEETK
jgi:hypothetical protein